MYKKNIFFQVLSFGDGLLINKNLKVSKYLNLYFNMNNYSLFTIEYLFVIMNDQKNCFEKLPREYSLNENYDFLNIIKS